jgi:hypothetical protein
MLSLQRRSAKSGLGLANKYEARVEMSDNVKRTILLCQSREVLLKGKAQYS